jgi:hypothetical protein
MACKLKKGTMFKKYFQWYDTLTPLKQLAVSFFINWCYWLIASLILYRFFFEQRLWYHHIFHATWMAVFMTIPEKWRQVKALFKSKHKQKAISDNNKDSHAHKTI